LVFGVPPKLLKILLASSTDGGLINPCAEISAWLVGIHAGTRLSTSGTQVFVMVISIGLKELTVIGVVLPAAGL